MALCLHNAPATAWEKCSCQQRIPPGSLRTDSLERDDANDPGTWQPDHQPELATHLRPGRLAATGKAPLRSKGSIRSACRLWRWDQYAAIRTDQKPPWHRGCGSYRLCGIYPHASTNYLFLKP